MTTAHSMRSARSKRVLDPAFLEGFKDLSTDDLRARRDESRAELEYLSYLRRVIQTRRDVLAAERSLRAAGPFPTPLAEVISGPKQGGSRGEFVHMSLPAQDMAEAESMVDAILGDLAMTLPKDVEDEFLESVISALDEQESAVSADRAGVIQVHDRIQEELKDRYRHDPTQIPNEI